MFESGHVRKLSVKPINDNDGSKFYVFEAGVLLSQKDKTQENAKEYNLWFILDCLGSVFSAFCNCKGGGDQGWRHLGATLFELENFLSNRKKSVTSCSAYWIPKPSPVHKPVPLINLKISHQNSRKRKARNVTPYDDSWIDSFDPRPNKHRQGITEEMKSKFAEELQKIDSASGILDYLIDDTAKNDDSKNTDSQCKPKDIRHLNIQSKLESFVKSNPELNLANLMLMLKNF